MTKDKSPGIGKKAVIAGAIGSAAIAAAALYMSKRKKKGEETSPPKTPTGEPPETD